MNKTFRALLSCGADSELAKSILEQKYTMGALRKLPSAKLIELGFSEDVSATIKGKDRKPIPEEVLVKVLHDQRFTCCVCKTAGKAVIIHHISPYAETQDNSEANLAVLCLDCHGKAHTKHDLAQNLTPAILTGLRNNWIEEASKLTSKSIVDASRREGAFWDYFNLDRLYELAHELGVNLKLVPQYNQLREFNIIDEAGSLLGPQHWNDRHAITRYIYEVRLGYPNKLYLYHKNILIEILSKIPVLDITNSWKKSAIKALVKPGCFIVCQRAFHVKSGKQIEGRGQTRSCRTRANNIRMSFEIDAWECTTNSARTSHLTGFSVVTAICLVRSVTDEEDSLSIKATCLAVGTNFLEWRVESTAKYRFYEPYYEEELEDSYESEDEIDQEPLSPKKHNASSFDEVLRDLKEADDATDEDILF